MLKARKLRAVTLVGQSAERLVSITLVALERPRNSRPAQPVLNKIGLLVDVEHFPVALI